ncbi:LOW QUALITY PROTEIN: cytochrome P450 4V2-like [Uloborus diversus]|uniref:LOW QUALITY PROTEIN: cytochrome P450 4V2-like n=1 Tax=Uloborus diversus TaxID=327109 RepID=UPI002409D726|nr:LOW QUALITY PROTEIN: cytochrome P450 4V2-like [Uloborus diversus]
MTCLHFHTMDLFVVGFFRRALLWVCSLFAVFVFRCWYKYRSLDNKCSGMPRFLYGSLFEYVKHLRSITCVGDIPTLSIIFQMTCGYCEVFRKQQLFFISLPFKPYIVLFNAKLIKSVINHPACLDKAEKYSLLSCIFKEGLVTSNGMKWSKRRKDINPTFHSEVLRSYIHIFNEQAAKLVKKMSDLLHLPHVEVDTLLSQCALDIICETAMGYKLNAQDGNGEAKRYTEVIHRAAKLIVERVFQPWTYHDDSYFRFFPKGRELKQLADVMQNFSRKVIEEKKASLLEQAKDSIANNNCTDEDKLSKKRSVFLEFLLEHHLKNPSFTLNDVQEEVCTFMAAGHDTTAITLRWVLLLLGLHPDIQDAVIRELDSVFGSDPLKPVTHDDINELNYMDCVIKETLRLYPPLPIIGREVTGDIEIEEEPVCQDSPKDVLSVSGLGIELAIPFIKHIIPKGSVVVFHIYMLHRDPEVFVNPRKFNPARFLPENNADRSPCAFIPFSVGHRNCIGQRFAMMELKVILSHILRNFTVTSLDQRDKIPLTWEISLMNCKPIRLRLNGRHLKQ